MGDPGLIFTVESGQIAAFRHYRMLGLTDRLMQGEASALAFARTGREVPPKTVFVDYWGTTLVDVDRRLLLTDFVGLTLLERRVARAVLAEVWAGWEVRWAHQGLRDVWHLLGLGSDLPRIKPPSEETVESEWLDAHMDSQKETWRGCLSVTEGAGIRWQWWGYAEITALLPLGPDKVKGLATSAQPPKTSTPDFGVHLDVDRRTVAWWHTDAMDDAPYVLAPWDGWTCHSWGDEFEAHERVTGQGLVIG